jgi:hypothetical protein
MSLTKLVVKGDESATTSHMEQQIHDDEEVELTISYSKLCLDNKWSLKDIENNSRIAELLDIGSHTRNK